MLSLLQSLRPQERKTQTRKDRESWGLSELASVSFGPGSPHADLRHQGQDIPEITGLGAWVLHHLQQQVRRGLGQSFGGLQEDLVMDHMAEADPRQL